jgi:Fe-S cluster assembly protein SufD
MNTAIQNINPVQELSELYYKNISNPENRIPEFIQALHKTGIDDFRKQGIPGKKSERYKYTFLEPLFQKEYKQNLKPGNFNFDVEEVFKCDVPNLDTNVVLLVNGFYYKKNIAGDNLPEGIWIGSLSKAALEIPELLIGHLGKIATFDDGLISMNSALFSDGILVYVPKNTKIDKPLQIINILLSEEDLMIQQRNLIILEENSSASIVICDHTLSANKFLSNTVTEIYVGKGAYFNQTSLQNEHNDAAKISSIFINQDSNSNVSSNIITLHGGLVRNNMSVTLNGEGAENKTSGLFLTDKTQHVDNYVFINHAKPHCTSNQLFKGVLDDTSTGSFNGRVLVSRDAQKTLAYQKSSNLLLTSEAKMNTRPQLEIYADDVKCSHGATVGQLDQEALYYMRTRGISKEEARLLLMYAFAHEIVDQIDVQPLKERIDGLVNMRLRGELTRCQNCSIHCC